MTYIFYLYASQELYQFTEQIHQRLTELERIFPESQFLKTQRALLFYHSKGLTTIFQSPASANPCSRFR